MSKTNKIVLISFIVALCAVIAIMSICLGVLSSTLKDYKERLNYSYQSSFYSLNDEMNNIETSLSKLSVSNSAKMQEKYLTEIASLCETAQNSLSALPLEHNLISSTYKFVNQLGGYASSLNQKLVGGNELDVIDSKQIEDLHKSSLKLKKELNDLSLVVGSDYSIVDNMSSSKLKANNFSDNFRKIYDETIKYPTLIYDGPFSDSTQNKTIKGLSNDEISKTEAEYKVKTYFKDFDVSFDGETNGKDFQTYNFSLKKGENSGYVQITKKGGQILSYYRDNVAKNVTKSIIECEYLAQEFANKLGFENVKIVWSQDANSCVYCNLCYVQDGVIVYPDMIKIKICRQTGDVIGLEAQAWAYNHMLRENIKPSFSEEEARRELNEKMEEISCRLCIIPDEYVGENLAWEFKCYYDDNIYYVYVNANTCEEEKVMKVVQTDDGNLLM